MMYRHVWRSRARVGAWLHTTIACEGRRRRIWAKQLDGNFCRVEYGLENNWNCGDHAHEHHKEHQKMRIPHNKEHTFGLVMLHCLALGACGRVKYETHAHKKKPTTFPNCGTRVLLEAIICHQLCRLRQFATASQIIRSVRRDQRNDAIVMLRACALRACTHTPIV